jgi:hypothetical protein
MILAYNGSGLLCIWEHDCQEPVFVWTYSVFEDYGGEAMTPSMYKFMAEYVRLNFLDIDYDGTYKPGSIEEDAFVAYYEVSINQRIRLHDEMMHELENLLNEEETWRGGHEIGAEHDIGRPMYMYYEEI